MAITLPLTRKGVNQRIFRTRPEDALPLTVQHQRIYIVPSRRGLAFLVALIVCLIASINYQLNLGYALSFLLVGLFSASLLHTYRNLAGTRIDSIGAADVTLGEPIKFNLRLANHNRQPRIGIDIVQAATTARCDLPAGKQTAAELTVPTTKRGQQPIGRLTLTSQFPVGLWTTWSYCHINASAVVFPKPEHKPPPLPRKAIDGEADAMSHNSSGDVSNLREYQAGDPLTRIAWKRAARGAGLHVRELEENTPGGDVELHIGATELHDTEAQMSRLAAWVNVAHQAGSAYALVLPTRRIDTNSGENHRKECLTALALYGLSPSGADAP